MLSVCIPVFNVDVRPLVHELSKQAQAFADTIEIITIDDCSGLFKEENRQLGNLTTQIELPENVGRARIRNHFLNYAKHDFLLFLDCDVVIDHPDFLSKYIDVLKSNPAIVCGGHRYSDIVPKKDEMLRWKYGKLKESKSAAERQKEPNKSFMTNNFVVKKSLLQEIKFDERLRQYGHEDTLFGLQLKKKNIEIVHVENSVLIGDSEKNDVFLNKTILGVKNLIHILEFAEFTEDLWNEVALLRFYKKTKFLALPLLLVFKCTRVLMERCFRKGMVSLRCFDFYKLGTLIESLRSKSA